MRRADSLVIRPSRLFSVCPLVVHSLFLANWPTPRIRGLFYVAAWIADQSWPRAGNSFLWHFWVRFPTLKTFAPIHPVRIWAALLPCCACLSTKKEKRTIVWSCFPCLCAFRPFRALVSWLSLPARLSPCWFFTHTLLPPTISVLSLPRPLLFRKVPVLHSHYTTTTSHLLAPVAFSFPH